MKKQSTSNRYAPAETPVSAEYDNHAVANINNDHELAFCRAESDRSNKVKALLFVGSQKRQNADKSLMKPN